MSRQVVVLNKEMTIQEKVDKICAKYNKNKSLLIQILLEIQEEFNWLPKEALLRLSNQLQISLKRIYDVATFYKAFSLVPKGRNLVKVCMGTACHVRKAPVILSRVTQLLDINPGETSSDLRFTLETVGCLGFCALGPVVVINDQYYSNPTTSELKKLLKECQ